MEDDLKWRWPQNMKSWILQQPLVGFYSDLKLMLIGLNQRVQRCQMKITSIGRQPNVEDDLKIWKVEYVSNHWSDLTQIWNLSLYGFAKRYTSVKWRWPPMEDDLKWRWPQNMKSWILQQPLVGFYSDLKLMLIGLNQRVQRCQMKITSIGRQPNVEDDLKIWKVEYVSNHWSDLTQIWNLSLYGFTKGYTSVKWRWHPMEVDLKWKMTSKYEK